VIRTIAAAALLLIGCDGPQSALNPAGRDAERLADLFFWMAAGAVIIWLVFVSLAVYALRAGREPHPEKTASLLIIGGGFIVPTIVLAVLLAFSLSLLPGLLAPGSKSDLKIVVSGEQWWWRVRYLQSGGEAVELANEIRLPVGERIELELESPDVIHSFWIPSIGGKMDMIPGRRTRLALQPTRTGVFRGTCAEYCGTSHALMSFPVVVLEEKEFAAWLEQQAKPAASPIEPLAHRGRDLVLANGCGACHGIRGTSARGVIGPDLTHVGGRLSIGAGILSNDHRGFLRFISRTDEVKPEVHMPAFSMLPPDQLRAMAAYLDGLQ
jgi:cytochrome c oxidase subunit 2